MPTALQNLAIDEELLTAMRLLKAGLRELNRGPTDFIHHPMLLLASGFERMMKTAICCHHLETKAKFPDREVFPKRSRGHDLVLLLKMITDGCFPDDYLDIPAAKTDIEFLRNDQKLSAIVKILSDFGQSARYYNLNVVLNEKNPGSSPEDEWNKLKIEVLKEVPSWKSRIVDPSQSDAIQRQITRALTVQCEKLARALARLFTIGGLGSKAKQISSHTNHFLFLMDDKLGEFDYDNIHV